jgi:hypothetical protein
MRLAPEFYDRPEDLDDTAHAAKGHDDEANALIFWRSTHPNRDPTIA